MRDRHVVLVNIYTCDLCICTCTQAILIEGGGGESVRESMWVQTKSGSAEPG